MYITKSSEANPTPDHVRLKSRQRIINKMQRAVPPHRELLDLKAIERLRNLTSDLLELEGHHALQEYERFLSTKERTLTLNDEKMHKHLSGKTIMVTGGTGCIGTTLINELAKFNPASIVSVSRGVAKPRRTPSKTIRNIHVDLCDQDGLERTFQDVKPDIVYHLAAQRDKSLAEIDVARTLSVNITGTYNILEAARRYRSLLVYASTSAVTGAGDLGVYALSKKICEQLVAQYALNQGVKCASVRYVHIIDNSIIHEHLKDWIARDRPIRLYGSRALIHSQSALEAAHLLLNAGMEAKDGAFSVQIAKNLEPPINLVDLALGILAKYNSTTPIYFYSRDLQPQDKTAAGTNDLKVKQVTNPMFSPEEAQRLRTSPSSNQIDAFPFTRDAHLKDQLRSLPNNMISEHLLGLVEEAL